MSVYEKLLKIQMELKCNKSQHNSFGNYDYRSCEDILEAVKPLCEKHKALIYLTDNIVEHNNKTYIEAIAYIIDIEHNEDHLEEAILCNKAYAREPEEKKGMDVSQITGSTSSYARKYALNGLLNIDDTKDADTNEVTKLTKETPQKQATPVNTNSDKKITEGQRKRLFALSKGNVELVKTILKMYGYDKTEDVLMSQYEEICKKVEGI